MIEALVGGLGWLLTQSKALNLIAKRLIERSHEPPRPDGRPPQIEVVIQPTGVPLPSPIATRLLVPPPGKLLFVGGELATTRPVVAIVLTDGDRDGRVLWVLGQFEMPMTFDLPSNAVAMLPMILHSGPSGSGSARLTLGNFRFTGTVKGHQVYMAN